ncbi:hypothetical protein Tco_1096997 [Tanacetum coccineum]
MRGTLLSSSISRITKSAGKVNLLTSTNIFSAIPTGYWNDRYANLMLILVFSTCMTFGVNTRDLGSFREEMDKITDQHQIHEEIMFSESGDDVAGIKRRHRDPSSDSVRDLVMASRRGRYNEDLE